MNDEEVVLIVVTLMIFAGLGVLWLAMSNRRAWREMEHRERLAMIQRGLLPAPESDPLGFEAATVLDDSTARRSERWRTAGTITIGLGLALMMLLTFTVRAAEIGIGVGGAFVVLGAALIFNGVQMGRADTARRLASRHSPYAQPPRSEPPRNVGP